MMRSGSPGPDEGIGFAVVLAEVAVYRCLFDLNRHCDSLGWLFAADRLQRQLAALVVQLLEAEKLSRL
jgi:hypothetical protein